MTTYPVTRAIFDRYGIPYQFDRITLWETIEQAAAARGHWATDALLDGLNRERLDGLSPPASMD